MSRPSCCGTSSAGSERGGPDEPVRAHWSPPYRVPAWHRALLPAALRDACAGEELHHGTCGHRGAGQSGRLDGRGRATLLRLHRRLLARLLEPRRRRLGRHHDHERRGDRRRAGPATRTHRLAAHRRPASWHLLRRVLGLDDLGPHLLPQGGRGGDVPADLHRRRRGQALHRHRRAVLAVHRRPVGGLGLRRLDHHQAAGAPDQGPGAGVGPRPADRHGPRSPTTAW